MTATLTRSRPRRAQSERRLDVARHSKATPHVSDCHAAEHLLIGTHELVGSEGPICITCRISEAAGT